MKTSFIADETSVFKEILITLQLHYITDYCLSTVSFDINLVVKLD